MLQKFASRRLQQLWVQTWTHARWSPYLSTAGSCLNFTCRLRELKTPATASTATFVLMAGLPSKTPFVMTVLKLPELWMRSRELLVESWHPHSSYRAAWRMSRSFALNPMRTRLSSGRVAEARSALSLNPAATRFTDPYSNSYVTISWMPVTSSTESGPEANRSCHCE